MQPKKLERPFRNIDDFPVGPVSYTHLIGTPMCVTYDFDSETDGCVTVRDRDTMEQIRLPIDELTAFIEKRLDF